MKKKKRAMLESDLEDIAKIERESFPYPLSLDNFRVGLEHKSVSGLVVEIGDQQLVAYALFLLEKERLVILTMAVDPGFRREGIGKYLLKALTDKLGEKRPRLIYMLRETNDSGIQFLRKMGLVATELVRNPYPVGDEDGIIFTYTIDEMDLTPPANRVYAKKD